jgi:hypothetical protein
VNKDYNFVKNGAMKNGWAYVTFIESMKKYKLPIRVIITTKHKVPVLNSLMAIDKFTYGGDKSGDVAYSIELKEFYEKFITFIDRDIEVAKYVKNYNKKQWAKKQLEKFGLLK